MKSSHNFTTRELRAALIEGYAWPGGYEIVFVTSDGALLCRGCVKENYRSVSYSMRHGISDGWRVVGIDLTCNMEGNNQCDHCSKVFTEDEALAENGMA